MQKFRISKKYWEKIQKSFPESVILKTEKCRVTGTESLHFPAYLSYLRVNCSHFFNEFRNVSEIDE